MLYEEVANSAQASIGSPKKPHLDPDDFGHGGIQSNADDNPFLIGVGIGNDTYVLDVTGNSTTMHFASE